jgi:type VI secretion system protein ImpK
MITLSAHPSSQDSDFGSKSLPIVNTRSLGSLMTDGFYMLLLVQRGQMPLESDEFCGAIKNFLIEVEKKASEEGISKEDFDAAKYAFCATVDEVILSSPPGLVRDQWGLWPLQMSFFGNQLAGDLFFVQLEKLRNQGIKRLPSLEVYYLCLLLGFQGKYQIGSSEELGFITARLGEELIFLKSKRTGFSPHWAPPDRVSHPLRRYVPMWLPALVLSVIGLVSYSGLRLSLASETEQQMAGYHEVIQMPSRTAHLIITLP